MHNVHCGAPAALFRRMIFVIYFHSEVTKEDVWLVSYPRSGTSWLAELMWNLVNKFDFETTRKLRLRDKFFVLDGEGLEKMDTLEACEVALGTKRMILTYLPIKLLPRLK